MKETVKRRFLYGTVDVVTGQYIAYDENELDEDVIDGVVASAAIPVMFPHKDWKESHYFDGGAVQGVDIVSAINSCKNLGYEESQIDLDVINLGANSIENTSQLRKKSLGML